MTSLAPLRTQSFALASDEHDGAIIMRFSGTGDSTAEQPLDDYLVRLHRHLMARELSSVLVDVTQLQFMNSSCIKAFASWIHDIKTSARPYLVRLRLNPGLNWQKRSLKTLARLAPDIVQLEEVAS